jgi:hypothetical protein
MFSFSAKLKYFLMTALINHWRNYISVMVLWVSNRKTNFLNLTLNQVKLGLVTWHFVIFLMATMHVIFLVKHNWLAQWTILLFIPKYDNPTQLFNFIHCNLTSSSKTITMLSYHIIYAWPWSKYAVTTLTELFGWSRRILYAHSVGTHYSNWAACSWYIALPLSMQSLY